MSDYVRTSLNNQEAFYAAEEDLNKCKKCKTTKVPGTKFCNECGLSFNGLTNCQSCKHEQPAGVQWCSNCGKQMKSASAVVNPAALC